MPANDSDNDNEIVFRICGDSAEGGVVVTGEIISKVLARCGLEVFTFHTNPAEIKGGPVMIQVRASGEPICSMGDEADVLVCWNDESWALNGNDLAHNGVLIYDTVFDPHRVKAKFARAPDVPSSVAKYGLPFGEIARRELRNPIAKNCVIMGAFSHLFRIPKEQFERVFRERWGKRGEAVVQSNLKAFEAGERAAQSLNKTDRFAVQSRPLKQRMLISGNEALCLGAVAAGCRVFAGYPITPASSILIWMEENLPRFGGVALQVEDEIAAIGVVVGASFTGKKAMTATSGPGLSLMVEFLGLAAMAEVPAVIVDAMRAGPSTGLPTKTEQGDLNIAAWAGHGDVSRIVLAPSTVQGCFYTIIHAFNLAEICQVPVIVLSETALSNRNQTIPPVDLNQVKVADRARPSPEEIANGYKRYTLNEYGVSPMSIPGGDGAYVATGLEHDEYGHPNWEAENHQRMTEKRFKKLQMALGYSTFYPQFSPATWYGPKRADVGIISWGSTGGAVREAEMIARREGYSVATLHVTMLNPLPVERVRQFIDSCQRVIIPELNYMGQLARLIRSQISFDPIQINKVTGMPITASEIVGVIRDVGQRIPRTESRGTEQEQNGRRGDDRQRLQVGS